MSDNILGDLSEKLFTLKDANSQLDDQKKTNNKEIAVVQTEILSIMESEDIEKCSTEFGSLARKLELYPSIDNFTDFFEFVKKTGATEFLQKRVNAAPVREMVKEHGTAPPGIGTFIKESLGTRINSAFKQQLRS